MQSPVYTAIKYRKIALFVLVVLLAAGAYNYYVSPRQENPGINAPIAMITVTYPGASPTEVESLVTEKIEDAASEIEGYDYSSSYSRNSVSVIIMRLAYGTDTQRAWQKLREKMDKLQDDLPAECSTIEIDTELVETAGVIIGVAGEGYTYEALYEYAKLLRDELSEIGGISRFDIDGKQEKNIVVEVDYRLLNQLDLSLEDIVQMIQIQNVEIPSGSLEGDGGKINVRTEGSFESVRDIENIIIGVSPDNGSVMRLSDLAEVSYELEESSYKVKEGHLNAVLLTGYFREDINIVLAGKAVDSTIRAFQKQLPDDLVFERILYQPDTVEEAVREFSMNLIQGILFVIAVVFIGMGMRNAVIVSTAIPASIFATFTMMKILEINIHQISIAALIVALGMLVDNAIVISDAIQVKLDSGEERMAACVEGTKSVSVPVLTSTLTTIAAFMPFLFLDSIAGEYIVSLPQIIMISLTASYLVALFITPSMAYLFFKPQSGRLKASKVILFFEKTLALGLQKKWAVVTAVILSLGMTVWIGTLLGLQFFPYADTDMVYMSIESHGFGDINQTEEIVDSVSEMLDEEPYVVGYTASVGGDLPKFYYTIAQRAPSDDYGQIMLRIDLKRLEQEALYETLTDYVDMLQRKVDAVITKGKVTVIQIEQAEPIGAPVRVRLTGTDMDRLGQAAEEVKGLLSAIGGTENIDDDFEQRKYAFSVGLNKTKASLFGISNYDVQNEVSIALRGRSAGVYRSGAFEYPVRVKSNIEMKGELENLRIKSAVTSQKVLLKEIAEINLEDELPVIKKYNRRFAVHVYSEVKAGYTSSQIQKALDKQRESLNLQGIKLEFDGEPEKIGENFGNVAEAAVYAIVAVYLILLIQFKSFVQPVIILITVPLAIVGSILGLYVFGQKLSFMAMLGMVSLLGIVVNNAIVLIDFINYELNQGMCVEEACTRAVEKRMRPIILSTGTTVIGLTPLVYSGSMLFVPMAVALMSGLLVSTLLTLIVIPVIYSMIMKRLHKC